MKIAIISDTHGYHDQLDHQIAKSSADVLIHCGDVSLRSEEDDIRNFANWFDSFNNIPHKICIAGNQDKYMSSKWFTNAIYLQDSGVTIDGIKFYGSPWTPTFYDWYWMKDRGEDIAERWRLIPDDTDVLITHGPPADCGQLDVAGPGVHVGCEDLEEAVNRVRPKIHCFGHIHEARGELQQNGTTFVNAAVAYYGGPLEFDL